MGEQNYYLTIAIPTHNRGAFLGRALDSILNQPHEGVEILVSDNASEDDTERVVRERMEREEINYIKNSVNIGPDANFLQCYEKASGKYIMLLGDDDLIAEGGIQNIKNFVEQNPGCSCIFLNHAAFKNEYTGMECCGNVRLNKENKDITTRDKKIFMSYAQQQITYMSSLVLSKEAFLKVEDPKKYIGTNFIHSCILLEATRDECEYGIVFGICVAQDFSHPMELGKNFMVFGVCMQYVFCELAPQFNYNKRQMRKLFVRGTVAGWRGIILRLKIKGGKEWKKEYKTYGKPVLKKHPSAYFRLMPYLLMPNWFARWFFKVFRPIYKKLKGRKW